MEIYKKRKVRTPERATSKSAGIDFFIPDDWFADYQGSWHLAPDKNICIPSGIHAKIPKGFALVLMDKSGVALHKGLSVGACVIDEDYQGEIHLHVINTSDETIELKAGDRLVQGLLIPVKNEPLRIVEDLDSLYKTKSERGENGFGSYDLREQ